MKASRVGFVVKVILAWVVVPLLFVELVVRVNPMGLFGHDADPYDHMAQKHHMEFDPELGWVPRPGRFDEGALTISSDRLRSNGHRDTRDGTVSVLAAGDSFTFGDGVADTETWPSYLEKMLDAKIHNAGVPSYGFDQTVLRVEKLIPQLKPTMVIASLIEDDIQRTTVSSRSNAAKPFFRLENRELVLDSEPLRLESRNAIRSLLTSSAVLRLVFKRWLHPEMEIHEEGLPVSCALTKRLAELQHRYKVPILLLAQMEGPHKFTAALLQDELVRLQQCAEESGLDVIDTYQALKEIRDSSPDHWERLWDGHMSAAGNRVVAEIVYDYLKSSRYAHLFKNDRQ